MITSLVTVSSQSRKCRIDMFHDSAANGNSTGNAFLFIPLFRILGELGLTVLVVVHIIVQGPEDGKRILSFHLQILFPLVKVAILHEV